MKILLLTTLLAFLQLSNLNCLSAQKQFNDFRTTQSVGSIPSDFTELTFEKIQSDLKNKDTKLSKNKERLFLNNIHYGIDEILHSGFVIYGDEISTYTASIADKLLVKNKELRAKLRFYTLKSNTCNAFSTDQGMIFVTTGLISQLTSEAQLALILAHEISHYSENHVVDAFENSTNHENIVDLSTYSKDNELEADRKGLELYKNAQYSKNEVVPTFDVLMYSYLPFDEVEFPKTYFTTQNIFIPSTLFPTKKYEIKAEENYDDSESSHPNIKNRKEAISDEIEKLNDWGNNVYNLGKDKFIYIRNICRFESVRTDILNSSYADAIYSIFILEKEFSNSIFLKRMKAQAWLGLAQFKENGSIGQTIDKNSELEGEIAAVHYFIKKLNKDGLFTIALRQVYDLYKENKNDIQLKKIYEYLIDELINSGNFKLDKYSNKKFEEASAEFYSKTPKLDTAQINTTGSSKYDKIKHKKSANNIENFDSTKYYFYGLSDVITDPEFTTVYSKYADLKDAQIKKEEEFERLPLKERKKILKKEEAESLNIGLDEVIIVEPTVYSYKKSELNLVKSEKLKHDFSFAIEDAAKTAKIKPYIIDRDHLSENGTEAFNERNTLFCYMSQLTKEENFNIFPVDYELIEDIKKNHIADKVLFAFVEQNAQPKFSSYGLILAIYCYPILPLYIPICIMSANETEINISILDLETSEIVLHTDYSTSISPKKHDLGAHMFNLFQKFKIKKSTK